MMNREDRGISTATPRQEWHLWESYGVKKTGVKRAGPYHWKEDRSLRSNGRIDCHKFENEAPARSTDGEVELHVAESR